MAKNIREIVKKLPKKEQGVLEGQVKALSEEEMNHLTLRAQEELGKLGLTVDQFKSAVSQRSKNRLKTRYPGVFGDHP